MNFGTIEKQKTSSEFWIWKNIERFVARHYICLLDKLFCIENEESDEPLLRYRNFVSDFKEHFSLLSRSQHRQGKHKYPFIGVYFGGGKKNRFYNCLETVDLYFHVVYNPVSPTTCDNNACSKCVTQLEEEYLHCVADILINMFSFKKKTQLANGYTTNQSDLFSELYCKDDWQYNMKVKPSSEPFVSEIQTHDDETVSIYVHVPLQIYHKTSDCLCDNISTCNC